MRFSPIGPSTSLSYQSGPVVATFFTPFWLPPGRGNWKTFKYYDRIEKTNMADADDTLAESFQRKPVSFAL